MRLFNALTTTKKLAMALLISAGVSLQAHADDTNFRLSVGRATLDISPSNEYNSDGDSHKQHNGWLIAGEMPQSNHTASRAQLYRIDDDGVSAMGLEMQIMWGWGLAQPGFRVYAGPSYFFEHRTDEGEPSNRFNVFRDIGASAGIGYQYQRWMFDISRQWRDPRSYERALKHQQQNDNVTAYSIQLLLGYQF